LSQTLAENTILEKLNLAFNQIGAEGCRHLSEALVKNSEDIYFIFFSLTYLNLDTYRALFLWQQNW